MKKKPAKKPAKKPKITRSDVNIVIRSNFYIVGCRGLFFDVMEKAWSRDWWPATWFGSKHMAYAIAELAPLPQPKDLPYAIEGKYTRRPSGGRSKA